MAKQSADFHSLEAALFSARKIAEERGEVVVLYFIEMAIAEAKMKSPPTVTHHKPQARTQSRGSRKRTNISFRVWSAFTV